MPARGSPLKIHELLERFRSFRPLRDKVIRGTKESKIDAAASGLAIFLVGKSRREILTFTN